MQKTHVAVLCGGKSAEHEISIESAKNVLQALDKSRYTVSAIFVTRQGEWFLLAAVESILNNPPMQSLVEPFSGRRVAFQPGSTNPFMVETEQGLERVPIDVVFPLLHGTQGEDGVLQGLLEMANIPYVGAGVLSSAVCMDKDVTKRLLRQAGVPVANWSVVYRDELAQLDENVLIQQLGLPLFVKPANAGSSVGVSKVKTRAELSKALSLAQQYDHKILVEQYIPGREIECSILGNRAVQASLPAEIIPHAEFYSYKAKYLDLNGATLKTPAELPLAIIDAIQTLAKKIFSVLGCDGMARIDFFLTPAGEILLNEANTLPGFTLISQYPSMWQVSGLAYVDLLNQLIELALARFKRDKVSVAGYFSP